MAAVAGDLSSWALVALLLFGGLLLIDGQPGFISIDCGSTFNYSDSVTKLQWTTDEGYISTGINRPVLALPATDNAQQVITARYFTEKRNKNCYVLPVAGKNNSYLVRASFLYGDLESVLPSNYRFNLSIDSTVVASIEILQSSVNTAQVFEFIVASTSSQIFVCIIPVVGKAFISSLELRPLFQGMYNDAVYESKFLKLLYRLNCGAANTDQTVRYPDDPYDRLWGVPGPNYRISSISTKDNVGVLPGVFDNPPPKVLQTAWSGDESFWIYWPFEKESTTAFYIALYFAEITNSTALRSIDIDLNADFWYSYNVTTKANEVFASGAYIAQGFANFTLRKSPVSVLEPLLNGAELHAIYDTVETKTASSDVSALDDLRRSLNLLDWAGDPCLPVALDWLTCSDTKPPRVTQVILSDFQLTGTIPASIVRLTELKDLWLDNNYITGSIPTLGSLYALVTLHLQNNSLTGYIPDSLADLPYLTELFLQENNLSGPVPSALLQKNNLNLKIDSTLGPSGSTEKKSSGVSGVVIGAVIGVVVVVILIVGFLLYFLCCRKKASTHPQSRESTGKHTGANHSRTSSDKSGAAGVGSHHVQVARAFTLEEVQIATNNFERKIGEGGFGPVYYGKLQNALEVAVKVNSANSGQGADEFINEVSLLSRVHHRNLVSLIGFCDEGGQQMLVYEFMHNGTLREHLYGKGMTSVVAWRTRLDIAVNAARGLEYLHNDCNPKIIHRDVKSNNILLNDKLLAKVADFGISKLAPEEDTNTGVSTIVRGTTGYLDPEYYSTNKLTQKSDVYAFGVVLLEMISGRAPNDSTLADVNKWNLVEYARGMLHDGNIGGIVDPVLEGTYNEEAMWKMAELAMFSVEPRSVNRPDMRRIVRELTEAVDLENEKGRQWLSQPPA